MRDDDPRSALVHLRRPHTQRGQQDTRLLLEAGLELVTEGLGEREGHAVMRFPWPTRAQVVERYNAKTGLRMSKAVFEDRWATAENYNADLLSWATHRGQWATHQRIARGAAAALTDTTAFSAVAANIALADLKVLLAATSFRIKLMVCAMHRVDPAVQRALADFYDAANSWWGEVYQQILSGRGLILRPDVDLRTFTVLMTAMEEGLAVRFLAHPESFGNSIETVAGTLTTGALALVAGAATSCADGTSLRDFTDSRMGRTATVPPASP
jgi:hypothetical protein